MPKDSALSKEELKLRIKDRIIKEQPKFRTVYNEFGLPAVTDPSKGIYMGLDIAPQDRTMTNPQFGREEVLTKPDMYLVGVQFLSSSHRRDGLKDFRQFAGFLGRAVGVEYHAYFLVPGSILRKAVERLERKKGRHIVEYQIWKFNGMFPTHVYPQKKFYKYLVSDIKTSYSKLMGLVQYMDRMRQNRKDFSHLKFQSLPYHRAMADLAMYIGLTDMSETMHSKLNYLYSSLEMFRSKYRSRQVSKDLFDLQKVAELKRHLYTPKRLVDTPQTRKTYKRIQRLDEEVAKMKTSFGWLVDTPDMPKDVMLDFHYTVPLKKPQLSDLYDRINYVNVRSSRYRSRAKEIHEAINRTIERVNQRKADLLQQLRGHINQAINENVPVLKQKIAELETPVKLKEYPYVHPNIQSSYDVPYAYVWVFHRGSQKPPKVLLRYATPTKVKRWRYLKYKFSKLDYVRIKEILDKHGDVLGYHFDDNEGPVRFLRDGSYTPDLNTDKPVYFYLNARLPHIGYDKVTDPEIIEVVADYSRVYNIDQAAFSFYHAEVKKLKERFMELTRKYAKMQKRLKRLLSSPHIQRTDRPFIYKTTATYWYGNVVPWLAELSDLDDWYRSYRLLTHDYLFRNIFHKYVGVYADLRPTIRYRLLPEHIPPKNVVDVNVKSKQEEEYQYA